MDSIDIYNYSNIKGMSRTPFKIYSWVSILIVSFLVFISYSTLFKYKTYLTYIGIGFDDDAGATSLGTMIGSLQEYVSAPGKEHLFWIPVIVASVITVILYFAARIVASIIGFALKIIFVHGVPKLGSRLGGMAIGAVKGALVSALLLFVVSFVFPFGFSQSVTDAMDKSKIVPAVCSVEYKFLSERLYSNATLEMMMNGAGYVKTASETVENL